MRMMTVADVIATLQSSFKNDDLVLIESSDGEYGPRTITSVHKHAGEKEPCGVDYPCPKQMEGFPVLRA